MMRSMIKCKEIKAIKDNERSKDQIQNYERKTQRRPPSFFRKLSALMKDKQSLVCIKLSGKKDYRNPNIEVAIVMATSHDESVVDYKNANRVFDWIKTSPTFLRSFLWCLTKRIEKTRSWVVALKGLMLVHGVFCTKIPAIKKIGRLPFDLSNFHDRYSKPTHAWGFSAFVRAYYAFLDQKSTFMSYEYEGEEEEMQGGLSMEIAISRLKHLQTLLDLLLQIKPYGDGMEVVLVLDAMDCVLIEIFEVYGGICEGIAHMLCSLFSMKTTEAAMALQILETVTSQNSQLSDYFEDCRRMRVLNAMELPTVQQQIPEEDIRDVKSIIQQILRNGGRSGFVDVENPGPSGRLLEEGGKDFKGSSQTIVTQDWVVFNDEMEVGGIEHGGKKDLFYDFGTSLDVGDRGCFNGLWHLQREAKGLVLVPHNGSRVPKIERDLLYI